MYSDSFQKYVNNTIMSGKLSHAYLFETSDFDRDFRDVLMLVKIILCDRKISLEKIDVCNDCNVCNLIDSNNFGDLRIVEPDGKEIKKWQLKELKDEFKNKSLVGNRRVYIIKNAEKLNSYAANSILKFLEEPEDDIVAILLTKNRYLVLDTIVSRCQFFSFSADSATIVYDENIFEVLEMIESKSLFQRYNYLLDNVFIDKETTIKLLSSIEKLMLSYIEHDENFDKKYLKILDKFEIDDIIKYIYVFEESIDKARYNVNFKLFLDSMYSNLCGGD